MLRYAGADLGARHQQQSLHALEGGAHGVGVAVVGDADLDAAIA